MPLASITLNGFKSFADKTKIDFNNGITGIVGPNGSGKSNITEAIRWVMGESSAKSLRGDNMTDVIFGGSEFRAPVNRAEVRLNFNNQDHQLKFDAPQIEVVRRVTRNGDSEFLINKKNVRLKDVHSLFMDSGLSRDSFSIISQGRVEQIFNSKAENRRAIIEEAAGVLHFKQQKHTAENQLNQTTENLIRINDLVNELKDRVEPLHEQSSLAKEYQNQKEQLDQKMVAATAFEIKQLLVDQGIEQGKLDEVNAILNKLDVQVTEDQTKLNEKRETAKNKLNQKDQYQEQLLELETKIADLTTNLKVSGQSSEYNNVARKELEQQQVENKTKIAEKKDQINQLNQKLANLELNQAELVKQEEVLNASLTADPDQLAAKLEDLRAEYIDSLQAQTSNKNDLLYLKAELEKLTHRNLQEQNSTDSEKLDEIKEQLEKVKAETFEVNAQIAEIENQKRDLTTNLAKLSTEFDNTKISNNHAFSQLQKIEAEITTLKRFQARHDGYYFGVKNVLNNQAQFPDILGTFGELIDFDVKYQDALNAALGSHVQSLVAKSQDSARNAIKVLKAKNMGRATFLPLDALSKRTISSDIIHTAQQNSGFIGLFSDLISSSSQIQAAIDFLLGNILVVDNIDNATKVAQKTNRRYRIVTLDGDILSPGGTMTGGAKQKSNNPLFENKARLQKLTLELNNLTKQTETFAQTEQTLQTKIDTTTQKLEQINQNSQNLTNRLTGLKYEESSLDETKLRLEQTLKVEQSKRKQFEDEQLQLTNKIKQAEQEQKSIQADVEKNRLETKEIQQKISNFDEQYQKVQQELNELLPKLAVLKTKIDNLNHQINDSNGQLAKLTKIFENAQNKLEQLDNNDVLSSKAISEIKTNLETLQAQKVEVNRNLIDLTKAIEVEQVDIQNLEQTTSRNYNLRKNAATEQNGVEVRLSKVTDRINQKLEFLSSEYSISYELALTKATAQFDEEGLKNLQREVKLHQMSIADIGPVNLNSIEEYNQVKARFDFLKSQEEDLLKAKEDLTNSMTELDNEVKDRFKKTFDQINAAFSEIFPIMFGGGHAKLLLTDPDELLTTGIEIIAQPPGKKLQQLSLLSGGERALTAITLLFAILKVNPVPFCILDEVEASLDEANVIRFAKFLQNYDMTTQFIVITHRQGTMEQADQLYGVVMQESGVSKILSVSLQDLKKMED